MLLLIKVSISIIEQFFGKKKWTSGHETENEFGNTEFPEMSYVKEYETSKQLSNFKTAVISSVKMYCEKNKLNSSWNLVTELINR
jgi:hypothetical protein